MMKKRKLGIIGGSGLYKMEGFKKTKWKKINTSWGEPSDEILQANFGKEEICFIPRHSRGHKINPTNMTPVKHYGYSAQWFLMFIVLCVMYVWFGFKKNEK